MQLKKQSLGKNQCVGGHLLGNELVTASAYVARLRICLAGTPRVLRSLIPQGRSQHTASCHNNSIIVFGGVAANGNGYNDVWVLDSSTDTWTQPHPGITDEMDDGTIKFREPWNNCPEPRGGTPAAWLVILSLCLEATEAMTSVKMTSMMFTYLI